MVLPDLMFGFGLIDSGLHSGFVCFCFACIGSRVVWIWYTVFLLWVLNLVEYLGLVRGCFVVWFVITGFVFVFGG